MGLYFTDKFSLLHFAVGVIVYYWNMSFLTWFVAHAIYEYVENTEYGMKIINGFVFWPGGKDHADSYLNRVGDQFYGLLGWIIAYIVCTRMD
jgi:hypothetical protein